MSGFNTDYAEKAAVNNTWNKNKLLLGMGLTAAPGALAYITHTYMQSRYQNMVVPVTDVPVGQDEVAHNPLSKTTVASTVGIPFAFSISRATISLIFDISI